MHLPSCFTLACVVGLSLTSLATAAEQESTLIHVAPPGPPYALLPAKEVKMSGIFGEALNRGVARLTQPPYSEAWLRADVSFEVNRIFTNYSGDVSGRFLELASLTSPAGQPSPAPLLPLMKSISRFQKADGHFGVDVDLAKPLPAGSAPIPMLWGNARLLVGLITAWQEFHDPAMLAAAKRLGDFYVASAAQLCSPEREADYHKSGTDGGSYTCCYFPAIEGLVLLHTVTKDQRYLQQAERMAEFFQKFDRLPIDHSHGNLCAWRGILMLYGTTGDRKYLRRAEAKWEAAMQGGYVWPLGGVGEHWYVSFMGDEGCSESDWLRFNLDLGRFTGKVRYLETVDRLLHNQYLTNQCHNGGFGMCHVDGDAAGPIGTDGMLDEWPFCCSFHGPLGLHFLKGYLAAGSEHGVVMQFPLDFTAPVHADGHDWLLKVRTKSELAKGKYTVKIELAPQGKVASAPTMLWVRIPNWASGCEVAPGPASTAKFDFGYCAGYCGIRRVFRAGETIVLTFQTGLTAEARRFQKMTPAAGQISRLHDVALLVGPELLFAAPVAASGRPVLLATIDAEGRLSLPTRTDGGYATVALPSMDANEAAVAAAIQKGSPVVVRPWSGMFSARRATLMFRQIMSLGDLGNKPWSIAPRRTAFQCDLVVVPATSIAESIAPFTRRVKEWENRLAGPFFGENLDRRPEVWLGRPGWEFTPQGLRVGGGDVGLLDGDGYADYRFEFDLVIPKEGNGIAGWVVRAKDTDNCLMFQIQAADSSIDLPQFKTRPNTLRPHVRSNGVWQVANPVPLGQPVRRGETHHVAVECRQGTVEVFLDGRSIHKQTNPDQLRGSIGFRAGGPDEQGLYRQITLKKL